MTVKLPLPPWNLTKVLPKTDKEHPLPPKQQQQQQKAPIPESPVTFKNLPGPVSLVESPKLLSNVDATTSHTHALVNCPPLTETPLNHTAVYVNCLSFFCTPTYLRLSVCVLYSMMVLAGRCSTRFKVSRILVVVAWSDADRFHRARMSSCRKQPTLGHSIYNCRKQPTLGHSIYNCRKQPDLGHIFTTA